MNKTTSIQTPPGTTHSKKIQWISILQGFTMLLVVLGHSDLDQKESIYWVGETYRFFKSFRMPLFLLISGYLFYLTRINKEKTFHFIVNDKIKRLGIPFLFFTLVGLLVKLLSAPFIKSPIEINGLMDVVYILVGLKENPLKALWFIQVTFLLMMFYPLYKIILSRKWATCCTLTVLVLMQFYFPENISFLQISPAGHLAIFFFSGIVIAHYKIDRFVRSGIGSFLLITALFFVCYYLQLPFLLLSFIGILFAMTFAKMADRHIPWIFQSFRTNTYQIYLISIFPQMAIEILFRMTGSQYFLPFFILNIFAGLYIPIVVVKLVKWLDWKWLKVAIGLA